MKLTSIEPPDTGVVTIPGDTNQLTSKLYIGFTGLGVAVAHGVVQLGAWFSG